MKKQVIIFVLITIIVILHKSGNLYAQEHLPIDDIVQQMKAMEKKMAYQNDDIRELKARLDEQVGGKIADAFNEAVFLREDLDQIVDKKIEEYFEKEENREKLASYIKLPLDIGYEHGFYLRTHDNRFSFKINPMFQFRYTFEDFDDKDDDSSFKIDRARLVFQGNAYNPNIKYFIQLETRSTGSVDGSKSVEMIDFFSDITYVPNAKIRFGQYRVPFNRQMETLIWKLQMIDRSVANNEFNLGRQLGVMVYGELLDHKLEYYGGFWNGNFRNESRNDNNEHLWIFRASYSPFGIYSYDESDLEYSESLKAHISASIAFDSVDDVTVELDDIVFVTAGGIDIIQNTVTADEVDRTQVAVEFGFKYRGLSLISEYYWRKQSGISDVNLIDYGFFVQAGYFLIPKKLELAGRYSLVEFDDELKKDSLKNVAIGVNYFFNGHGSKLQFNAVRFNEENGNSDNIDYKYIFQYQVAF
ncbi:MAG: porin [Candidatus Anammoxibacter sp.]